MTDPTQRERVLNTMAEAFENRIGTTHGIGDGLRAALDALERGGWRIHRPCPGCCNCAPSSYNDPMCDGSGERR